MSINKNIKIKYALDLARAYLRDQKIRTAFEAEILLAFVLQKSREYLHINPYSEISDVQLKQLMNLVNQRRNNVPLEYIIKSASFFGMSFDVDFGVLIPRPETELLVIKALRLIEEYKIKSVLEIGVGSGIISICLALAFADLDITALDISPTAIKITEQNIKKFQNNLPDLGIFNSILRECDIYNCESFMPKISLHETDFRAFKPDSKFDLIISNPPYISRCARLEPHVLKEPEIALFGGLNGTEILEDIVHFAKKHSNFLICEIGFDQKAIMAEVLKKSGFIANFYIDFSYYDRGFIAKAL
ncbi:MAG: HemK/PrmC family methyltransferase [Helicobacter sp.]|nr:HemK/PrmC family methyltransferase [Helicobacter sp.]